MATTWPIVGRTTEVTRLRDAVDACLDGAGSMLHVEAVAGAGKTYLLDHIADSMAGRLGVVRTTLRSGTPVPYAVPLALLEMNPRQLGLAPDGPRSLLEAGVGHAADALAIESLLGRFDDRYGRQPTLLVVDDLHLADAGSMLWLTAAAESDWPPCVLLTAARPPEAGTAFGRSYDEFGDSRTVLALDPLSDEHLDDLVEARFDRPPGSRLLASLRHVGGSPLVLTAMLEALDDDDVVLAGRQVDVSEEVAERLRTQVPHAVALRVGAVAGDDATTVAAMAIGGEIVDVADVAAVLGVPLAEVITVRDRIERAGLMVFEDAHRFRHDHYRLAAVELVDPPTRRALHAAFAQRSIERTADPRQVADHLIGAGAEGDDAAHWLALAAAQLVELDPATALDLIAHSESVSTTPDRRRTVHKVRALVNVGRIAESEAIARHLLLDATPDEQVALQRDLGMIAFQRGDMAATTAAAAAAAAALAPDDRRRARLDAENSFAHLWIADFATARTIARAASQLGEQVGDLCAVVAADMVGGLVALYDHDLVEAERLATRLEAFGDLPEAAEATVYQPWFSASLVRLTLGQFDHARRLNATGRQRSDRSGYAWMVPAYDALDAYVAFNRGDLDDTLAFAEAAIHCGIDDSFGAMIWCHSFVALVAAARGDWERTRTSAAAGRALVRSGQAQFGWTHLALAETALAEHEGRPADGYEALCATWDAYEAFGLQSARQEFGSAVARLAHLLHDDDRLDRVAAFVQDAAERTGHPLWQAEALEVTAWRDGDDATMCRASELFSAADRRWRAAETMAYAAQIASANSGSKTHWYASKAAQQLDAIGATELAAEMARLGGRDLTPAERAGGNPAEALTPSERAVVELVAQGLTNSQIAERLFVSRRTVESHVSASYRKLNLNNRVELARAVLDG
ncbi:MAG TPA: LuxR C-terminal-related transcriptional regulator [Ilumatobacteraceae bacterium]|nr:LuxR C-terminal-related transcriptional regulator [Ilumatobacteraceae bacterium]